MAVLIVLKPLATAACLGSGAPGGELTHKVDGLMAPMLLSVVEATVISRLLRARSIYSARLPGTSVDAHEASYGDRWDALCEHSAERSLQRQA